MGEIKEFSNREDFRKWLYDNCLSSAGVWLLFGKAGGPKTIKAGKPLKRPFALAGLMDKWQASIIKPIRNTSLCAEQGVSGRIKQALVENWRPKG